MSTPEDELEIYQYKILPDNESFRLLSLHPSEPKDPLVIELRVHTLQVSGLRISVPAYEAVSYVWGDSSLTKSVKCDGKVIPVTSSLETALRRLRNPRSDRVLWIDQLCIDQGNYIERSKQVQIMSQIYSRAERTLVWLGYDGSDKAHLAQKIVEKTQERHWKGPVDAPPVFIEDGDAEINEQSSVLHPEWDALDTLFKLPYFERLWVVQEALVSSRNLLLWGDYELAWDEVGATIFWLKLRNALDGSLNSVFKALPNFDIQNETWVELLYMTGEKKAADPRDRIFALIGLAEKGKELGSQKLQADYTKSFAQVSTEFAHNLIKTSNRLYVLSHAEVQQLYPTDKVPLWAPRWGPRASEVIDWDDFKASGDFNACTRDSLDPSVLICKGLSVDSMVRNGDTLMVAGLDDLDEAIAEAWRIVSSPSDSTSHVERNMAKFVSTITADKDWPRIISFPTNGREGQLLDFSAYLLWNIYDSLVGENTINAPRRCQRYRLELAEYSLKAYKSTNELPSVSERSQWIGEEEEQMILNGIHKYHPHVESVSVRAKELLSTVRGTDPDVLGFQRSLSHASAGRKFFLTAEGRMGIGPRLIEPGDQICILFGGRLPFALRPTALGRYLFLGECYVDGLMKGEAVEMWKEEELETEFFELC